MRSRFYRRKKKTNIINVRRTINDGLGKRRLNGVTLKAVGYHSIVEEVIARLSLSDRCICSDSSCFYPAATVICKRMGHDLSSELLKQRVTYNGVRSQLRKLNLRCGFTHPAKLLLTFQNTTHALSTAKEAQDFLEKHLKPNTQGDELTDLG